MPFREMRRFGTNWWLVILHLLSIVYHQTLFGQFTSLYNVSPLWLFCCFFFHSFVTTAVPSAIVFVKYKSVSCSTFWQLVFHLFFSVCSLTMCGVSSRAGFGSVSVYLLWKQIRTHLYICVRMFICTLKWQMYRKRNNKWIEKGKRKKG